MSTKTIETFPVGTDVIYMETHQLKNYVVRMMGRGSNYSLADYCKEENINYKALTGFVSAHIDYNVTHVRVQYNDGSPTAKTTPISNLFILNKKIEDI
jgi:hypothetical protein